MGTSPWWFTPLLTFAGVVFGGAVSIVTAWLTQRYTLKSQLAVRRADAEVALAAAQRAEQAAAAAALRMEREKRYLAILQNVESLYESNASQAARRGELLKIVREVWLFGDEDVRKVGVFLADIAQSKEANPRERLFGDVVLYMRKSLGLPDEGLTNEDFRLHSA